MAQFTAQGRLKLLFSREGSSFGLESNDSSHYNKLADCGFGVGVGGLNSVRRHKSKQLITRLTTRVHSSSSMNKFRSLSEEGSHDADYEYDSESERDDLACFRGLVLDISYRPVNVVCWRRAICLEFMEKADVLEYYDQTVNSTSGSFYIPAVLRVPHLLQVVRRRRIVHCLSRKSILFRDNYTCQYCSSVENLTIDHVLPIAQGGEWKWENLVTACSRCNSKKGHKTPEEANMKLKKAPKVPKDYDVLAIPLTNSAIRMLRIRKGMPEEWRRYLGQSSSLP